jgi:hypothetical protein
MKHDTVTSGGPATGSTDFVAAAASSSDVFYVVRSNGRHGERDHFLCSAVYETLRQAEPELARLRDSDPSGTYSVWKSTTYVGPQEWLHRVVRADGTLIQSRLYGVERYGEVEPRSSEAVH